MLTSLHTRIGLEQNLMENLQVAIYAIFLSAVFCFYQSGFSAAAPLARLEIICTSRIYEQVCYAEKFHNKKNRIVELRFRSI